MTAEEIFDAIAPAYASSPSKAVFLAMAEERTSDCFFGVKRPQAVAFRAAHSMALALDPARANGTGGAITQKREGDLSVSFDASKATGDDGDLSQTSFGRQLLGLIQGSGAFVGVSGDVLGGPCGE